MAEQAEFIRPPFLEGQSAEEIHRRMLETLPADIDRGEGGFPWDFTRPTANEKAEFAGMVIESAIRSIFPAWCDPYLLPFHGEMRGIKRKAAEPARGTLELSGAAGTEIPAGFVVSTAADYDRPSVSFTLDRAVTLEEGPVQVPITAAEPGAAGNAAAGAVVIVDSPIVGLRTITNPQPMEGGLDEETDEAFRARIVEYDLSQGVSFVGSDADYKRWAMEVPGVGTVQVQGGEAGDNTVKLIVTDAQGGPAGEELRQAVYDHIMRPDDRDQRLAGVNDLLLVLAPEKLTITVEARVTLDGTALLEEAAAELLEKLDGYYHGEEVSADRTVRYTEIGALLLDCRGVVDYDPASLKVNGGMANLTFSAGEIPVTERSHVTLTEVRA